MMKKSVKITLISVISIILCLIIGAGAFVIINLNRIRKNPIPTDNSTLGIDPSNLSEYSDEIINIALFGVDRRGSKGNSRSDAIMILSIDNKHNKFKLSSVMRDSYVSIDGHGKDKMGHAYFFGGPELAISTLNKNFKLDIRDYVTVDFDQMAHIVDAMGGVTIDVSAAELPQANLSITEQAQAYNIKNPTYLKKPGEQLLNGIQAVAYARIRYVGDADFQRTDRQREVLEQLFNKALKMDKLQYPQLLSQLAPYFETSLSNSKILSLGMSIVQNGTPEFAQARYPEKEDLVSGSGSTINGISYLVFDEKITTNKMHQFIYEDGSYESAVESDTSISHSSNSSSKSSSSNAASSKKSTR